MRTGRARELGSVGDEADGQPAEQRTGGAGAGARRHGWIVSTAGLVLGALVWALFLALPVRLSSLDLPIVRNSYGKASEPLELAAWLAVGLIVTAVVVVLAKRPQAGVEQLLPVLCPAAVGVLGFAIVGEFSLKAADYEAYQGAAEAVLRGGNPYAGTGYLYPPLPAQAMAALYTAVAALSPGLGLGQASPEAVWGVVFYAYQATQAALLIGAWILCYLNARALGSGRTVAALATTLLLLGNGPMIRTLRHNQVNLWLLNLIFLSLLLVRRYPHVAGLAMQLGAHIKLYPAILLLPWAVAREWRALGWALGGFAAIVLWQTEGGRSFEHWAQFISLWQDPPPMAYFRNSSLRSLFHNILLLGGGGDEGLADVASAAAAGAIGLWFVLRAQRREAAFARAWDCELAGADREQLRHLRLYGHSADAIVLTLLVSPITWSHHYVLAVPLFLLALARCERRRMMALAAAWALVLALPTVEVFPLSYLRPGGLLLLAFIADPRAPFALSPERDRGRPPRAESRSPASLADEVRKC